MTVSCDLCAALHPRWCFPCAHAEATRVRRRLQPMCRQVAIAGSIRRQVQSIGDIEIVAEPMMNGDLFGGDTPILDPIFAAMRDLGQWEKGGDRYMRVRLPSGMAVDLFLAHPPAQWGSILLIRTGPAEYTPRVMANLIRRGYRHRDGYVTVDGGVDTIPTPTETHLLKLAGMRWAKPEARR